MSGHALHAVINRSEEGRLSYTALPSSSLSLSREAGLFSAVGVGPGLEEGEERERRRERKGGEKQNKTDLLALYRQPRHTGALFD